MPPVPGTYAGGTTLTSSQTNPGGNPSQSALSAGSAALPAGFTPAGSSGGGGGGGSTVSASSGGQQLAAGINSLLGAIASGNKQAFDEAVRQFNLTFGLDKDKFTEAIRQFNQNFAISQSGVTGMYNGGETQQSQLQRANIAAQQAGLTGYYQAPQGTGNLALDAFQGKASQSDQQTYLNAEGGDVQKAAEHYLRDVTGAVQASVVQAGGQWTPNSMQSWVYGTPGAYGTGGGQGVETQQAIAQRNQIAQNWAQQYGYVPTFDANGNPVFQAPTAGAGGTMSFNGAPTTLAAQQQAYAQQLGAITTAASLQANPFRQQQVIGQLGGVLNPGGAGAAGFQAPNTVAGVGTAGGNTQGGMGYLQQMIDDIRNPGANQASMNSVLGAIPTPNKLNSTEFLRSAPSTQNMVLQGIQEKYGIDPNDALAQIKNTLPQFQAPTTVGAVKR